MAQRGITTATRTRAATRGFGQPDRASARLNWNQVWAARWGRPVVKNKLFYFVHYEGFVPHFANQFRSPVPTAPSQRRVSIRTSSIPLPMPRFPNRTIIPQSAWTRLGKKVLALYPDPTCPACRRKRPTIQTSEYKRSGERRTHAPRRSEVDYKPSAKDLFSAALELNHRRTFRRESILKTVSPTAGSATRALSSIPTTISGATWTRTITPHSSTSSARIHSHLRDVRRLSTRADRHLVRV